MTPQLNDLARKNLHVEDHVRPQCPLNIYCDALSYPPRLQFVSKMALIDFRMAQKQPKNQQTQSTNGSSCKRVGIVALGLELCCRVRLVKWVGLQLDFQIHSDSVEF